VKRRTFASVRLCICANVFARSRIHFDARVGPALPAALIDRLQACREYAPADAAEADVRLSAPRAGAQITVH
jgi:hypothetical protein